MARSLLYEKKLASLPKVISELETLDPDAGIRAAGRLGSRNCFVFVTKSMDTYTVALYSVKKVKKESFPDKRLAVKEFSNLPDLGKFLSGVISKPVKASAY